MQLPRQNDSFAGEYLIQDKLGEGGFAVVFRASWRGQTVALKILKPQDDAYSFEVVVRFNRESRILAELQHPNVPRVFDHGRSAEGLLYIASEFVPGEELRQLINRGAAGEELTLHVVREVLEALAEPHSQGLLHRDIKPENIRLTPIPGAFPKVTLLDFGIARHADPEQGGRLTETGVLVGTPRYMSPEQLMTSAMRPSSDLYSVAMVGAEMLGGADALHGAGLREQIDRVAGKTPVELPVTRGPLAAVLRSMLAVDPASRPQSVAAVLAALDGAAVQREAAPTERGSRRLLWLGLGVVVCVVGLAAAVFMMGDESPPPPEQRRDNPLAAQHLAEPPDQAAPQRISEEHTGPPPDARLDEPPAVELPELAVDGRCDAMPVLQPGLGRSEIAGHPGDHMKPTTSVFYYLPRYYDRRRAHPAVLMFHDTIPDTPGDLFEASGFQQVADQNHVVIILVDDQRIFGTPWTSKRRVTVKNGFDHVDANVCLDRERIFAVGNGRGGRAAMYMPCLTRVRAIATNGWRSDVGEDGRDAADCAERVPYLHVVGRLDRDMPFEGGDRCTSQSAPLSPLAAHHRSWKDLLGCTGAETAWEVDARCKTWTCRKDYVSCEFDAGRSWGIPFGCQASGPETPGLADLMWRFFDSVGAVVPTHRVIDTW